MPNLMLNFCSCGVQSDDDYTFDHHIESNPDVVHITCSEREFILYEHIRELEQLVLDLDNKLGILQSTVSYNLKNFSSANTNGQHQHAKQEQKNN